MLSVGCSLSFLVVFSRLFGAGAEDTVSTCQDGACVDTEESSWLQSHVAKKHVGSMLEQEGDKAGENLSAVTNVVELGGCENVGLYYASMTGNTETVAQYIANAAGSGIVAQDIGDVGYEEIMSKCSIIVGAPTWHTGEDEERSGTSWDEWLYDTLPGLDMSDKKIAVFGLGDSAAYGDNFCDAMGELSDLFKAQGATIYGKTPIEDGLDYSASMSVSDGKFIGKTFDENNHFDKSEDRAKEWVEQLKLEGFF